MRWPARPLGDCTTGCPVICALQTSEAHAPARFSLLAFVRDCMFFVPRVTLHTRLHRRGQRSSVHCYYVVGHALSEADEALSRYDLSRWEALNMDLEDLTGVTDGTARTSRLRLDSALSWRGRANTTALSVVQVDNISAGVVAPVPVSTDAFSHAENERGDDFKDQVHKDHVEAERKQGAGGACGAEQGGTRQGGEFAHLWLLISRHTGRWHFHINEKGTQPLGSARVEVLAQAHALVEAGAGALRGSNASDSSTRHCGTGGVQALPALQRAQELLAPSLDLRLMAQALQGRKCGSSDSPDCPDTQRVEHMRQLLKHIRALVDEFRRLPLRQQRRLCGRCIRPPFETCLSTPSAPESTEVVSLPSIANCTRRSRAATDFYRQELPAGATWRAVNVSVQGALMPRLQAVDGSGRRCAGRVAALSHAIIIAGGLLTCGRPWPSVFCP